jgi:uncharacterized protein (TIGR02453 family)
MPFNGWPEEALEFYEGLEADNSKAYWNSHRHIYDEMILRPMEELLGELAPEFGEAKIFRPYRDVRFSKDKSPYKTQMGATAGGGYIQLSARGLAAGAGMYEMSPGQLAAYRQAVASDGAGGELTRVIAAISRRGIGIEGRNVLKTAPRGYDPGHPRIELLRYKGLFAWKQWPVEAWLCTAAAKDRLVGFFRAAQPLSGWLAEHVAAAAAHETASQPG